MNRKFFVDCVIAFALCLVVRGAAPALVVAQDNAVVTQEELDALGIKSKPTFTNRCCSNLGSVAPCGEENQNQDKWKMCITRGGDCSPALYWTCSCQDWARKVAGGGYLITGCACA